VKDRKKKTTKKKEDIGDSEQLNTPKQRFKWHSFVSPGGF